MNIGLTAAISLNACRVNIWRILNIRGLFHQRQHSMRKRIRSSERVFGETSAFKRACFHGFRTLNVLAQLSALATKGAFARHTSACTQHGRLVCVVSTGATGSLLSEGLPHCVCAVTDVMSRGFADSTGVRPAAFVSSATMYQSSPHWRHSEQKHLANTRRSQ